MAGKTFRILVAGMLATLLALPVAGAQAQPPEPVPARISVYNININKMERQWKKWIAYIDENNFAVPEVILVQDMKNRAGRVEFQEELGRVFGGRWNGRAGASGMHGWHTAVVWRAKRFEFLKKRGWWGHGDADPHDGKPVCLDGRDGTSADTNNGSPAVQVRLKDKLTGSTPRYVSAVSFKTSGAETPKTCAWKNMRKVNFKLQASTWTGDIMVLGTDANSSDRTDSGRWRCWYRGSNANIPTESKKGCDDQRNQRFYDPIFEKCAAQATAVDPQEKETEIKACLTDHHSTRSDIRIDFVMAKVRSGVPVQFSLDETDTLPWKYSPDAKDTFTDHRTHRTVIYY